VSLRKYRDAETAFVKVVDLQPGFVLTYFNLAEVLSEQARFDEALAFIKKGRDRLPAQDPLREQSQPLLQRCQRYVTLDARLPRILKGTEKPQSAVEQIELAELCRIRKLYAAAALFYASAFAAEPKLAQDVPKGVRYNAACAAVLAGCALGKDPEKPDEKERARWRRQALDWLREDLSWWARMIENGTAQARVSARQWLHHAQRDPDLAGIRDEELLAKLSAQEQKAFAQLWADVAELLKKTEETTK
jgi:serine/threonine-protein kinase